METYYIRFVASIFLVVIVCIIPYFYWLYIISLSGYYIRWTRLSNIPTKNKWVINYNSKIANYWKISSWIKKSNKIKKLNEFEFKDNSKYIENYITKNEWYTYTGLDKNIKISKSKKYNINNVLCRSIDLIDKYCCCCNKKMRYLVRRYILETYSICYYCFKENIELYIIRKIFFIGIIDLRYKIGMILFKLLYKIQYRDLYVQNKETFNSGELLQYTKIINNFQVYYDKQPSLILPIKIYFTEFKRRNDDRFKYNDCHVLLWHIYRYPFLLEIELRLNLDDFHIPEKLCANLHHTPGSDIFKVKCYDIYCDNMDAYFKRINKIIEEFKIEDNHILLNLIYDKNHVEEQ